MMRFSTCHLGCRLLSFILAACVIAALGCASKDRLLAPSTTSEGLSDAHVLRTPAGEPARSTEYEVLAFDVPPSLGEFTSAFNINNRGTIVGNYGAPDGSAHGFIFSNSQFTDVTVPGAVGFDLGSLGGVNDGGTATGSFSDAADIFHPYLRGPSGALTFLPDALPNALSTDMSGINNRGTLVGTVTDEDGNDHGFLNHSGVYSAYDHPGAVRTRLFNVNDHEQAVGFWVDAGRVRHGFLLENGIPTPIEVPGAVGTSANGINNRGQIVGFYTDPDLIVHGYLLDHGAFKTLDFPGSTDTRLTAINDHGVIVGTYDFFSRGLVALLGGHGLRGLHVAGLTAIESHRLTQQNHKVFRTD